MDSKAFREILRNLSMLTQLGLSLLTPLLLCLGACYLLQTKLHAGLWVYIPGFILGLGSAFAVAKNFWQMMERQNRKNEEEQEDPRQKKRRDRRDLASFNRHI